MKPFAYTRARDAAGRARGRSAASRRAKFIARRDEPHRPDEGGRRAAGRAGRRQPPPTRPHRGAATAACGSARWRATATRRTTPWCASATRSCPGDPCRRIPQLRNMATIGGNLMQRTRCPYFYDVAMPLQQAPARFGAAARSTASTASTRSSAPASSASPLTLRTCASRLPRSTPWCSPGAARARAASRSPTSTACPATRPRSTRPRARRADHRRSTCRRVRRSRRALTT